MTPESNLASHSATAAAPQGFFSRLIGVYFSPGETFEEIGHAPRVLLPLLLVMLLGAFSSFITTYSIGYENLVRKQMEPAVRAGWMTQEQAEQQIQRSTTGTMATIGQIQGPVFGAIALAVFVLAAAGIFKLFSLLLGTENTFKGLLSVTLYSFLAIGLISVVLLTVVLSLKRPEEIDLFNPIGSNLGAVMPVLMSDPPKFATALASWVDLFGIWRIALMAIGYAAVSRKLKVSTAAIFLGFLYLLMALVMSALTSLFS
jgi:hypothetical protein